MPGEREQRIRERAYFIWEQKGRPHGEDVAHWLRAESDENLHAALKETGFAPFETVFSEITTHSPKSECEKFAKAEFERFRSIAGTILLNCQNVSTNVSERIITHILMRSIIENYFWLLYIFDGNDKASWNTKFDEYLNSFKIEYSKLYAEPLLPRKAELQPPDPSWRTLTPPKDLNSLLVTLRNDYGDRLNYIYFLYRRASFDTHGKSLPALFDSAFGKTANFPYLKIDEAVDLIANEYLVIWQKIRGP